jgi:hypothetical protein
MVAIQDPYDISNTKWGEGGGGHSDLAASWQPRNRVDSRQGQGFFSLRNAHADSGIDPAPYSMRSEVSFLGGKATGTSNEVKNAWSCASTPQHMTSWSAREQLYFNITVVKRGLLEIPSTFFEILHPSLKSMCT